MIINENPPPGWTNMDLYWPGDPRAMRPTKPVKPKSQRKTPRRKGLKREVRGSCVVLSLRDPKSWQKKRQPGA